MARRISTSREDVPYRPKKHIEEEAAVLLAEYSQKHCEVTEPPIPIDDIVEIHLGLTFEIKDMRALFGHGDVHGALWINDKRVGVDQSLDPDVYPAKLGRFRFTLAHETGHWRLHRTHYLKNRQQRGLFDHESKPSFICRSSDTQPVEWQANAFAAYLLMLRDMVLAAWEAWRGNLIPLYLENIREWYEQDQSRFLRSELVTRAADRGGENALDEILMEYKIAPLAERFQVSTQAMRIRLESLKLLLPRKEPSLFE